MKKYQLMYDAKSSEAKAGDVVYISTKYDYGLAEDDTRYTGVEHISVTLNSDGDYPTFTIPLHELKEIQ